MWTKLKMMMQASIVIWIKCSPHESPLCGNHSSLLHYKIQVMPEATWDECSDTLFVLFCHLFSLLCYFLTYHHIFHKQISVSVSVSLILSISITKLSWVLIHHPSVLTLSSTHLRTPWPPLLCRSSVSVRDRGLCFMQLWADQPWLRVHWIRQV